MHITDCDMAEELLTLPASPVAWVLSVGDGGSHPPAWLTAFTGPRLRVAFDDIDRDWHAAGYRGAGEQDVAAVIAFAHEVHGSPAARQGNGLVHCGAGISRSSACAIILAAALLGPGREDHAVAAAKDARTRAAGVGWRPPERGIRPNRRLVDLADRALARGGRLLAATVRGFEAHYLGDPYVPPG
jgi:predicted protein tyrosine phosphatase